MPKLFRCKHTGSPCKCTPGRPDICDGTNCECDTHMLDPLTAQQLGDLIVKHSEFDFSDVCTKTKNELWRMVYEAECEKKVMKDGCALLRAARRPSIQSSRDVCTPDHILQSIIDKPSSSTPVARKLLTSTISKKNAKKPAKKQQKNCNT